MRASVTSRTRGPEVTRHHSRRVDKGAIGSPTRNGPIFPAATRYTLRSSSLPFSAMTMMREEVSTVSSRTRCCANIGCESTVWSVVTSRHGQARGERRGVAACLAAEDAEFMLQGNDLAPCHVQDVRRMPIVLEIPVVDLKLDGGRVVVGVVRVRHGDDAGWLMRPQLIDRLLAA